MNSTSKAIRRISITQACERMKRRLGMAVTPGRLRQIVVEEVSRGEDGIIKAVRLGRRGWWGIDPESFERWLDQDYEE